MKDAISVFWFRRDLRLQDNRGLYEALRSGKRVLPIFIFDTQILGELPKDDARVNFIHDQLRQLDIEIQKISGGNLHIFHGVPESIFSDLLQRYSLYSVYTNCDYEPYAQARDKRIENQLEKNGVSFHSFKDQVIFEKDEIVKDDGAPYVVYTPYMKKWKLTFRQLGPLVQFDSFSLLSNQIVTEKTTENPSLEAMGFTRSKIRIPDFSLQSNLISNYAETRDFPSKDGTSHLGPHLRFGTVSVRSVLKEAIMSENETFWNELIWREFFMQILWHFPHTMHASFKSQYDRIKWRNNEEDFEKWKSGQTGFALVDAGMRELNATGYMHNRVRMLTASFLCKHLLIDWRLGEAYFAEKLLDFELASNVGNWQWAAGSGVDAAPYFRIFNPETQILKFDKQLKYIRKWVPEYESFDYPQPMVDHKFARERCLATYKAALT
jgi:deoxyribodipyrimidine photo-lyase